MKISKDWLKVDVIGEFAQWHVNLLIQQTTAEWADDDDDDEWSL